MNHINEVEEGNILPNAVTVAAPAAPIAPVAIKRPMTDAERERNERRKAAFVELRGINPKAKWTNASKLVAFRNRKNANGERALLNTIRNSKPANNKPKNNVKKNKTKKAPAVAVAPKVAFKNLRAQVTRNVTNAGVKLNAARRQQLAALRRNNPGLSIANYLKNHAGRTRKFKPLTQTQKEKLMQEQRQQRRIFQNIAPIRKGPNPAYNLGPNKQISF